MIKTTLSPEIAAAAKPTRKRIPSRLISFRREVAKQACERGVLVARLALERGINTNLLPKWRAYQARQYEPPTLLRAEMAREDSTIENGAALPFLSQSKADPGVSSRWHWPFASILGPQRGGPARAGFGQVHRPRFSPKDLPWLAPPFSDINAITAHEKCDH